MTGLNIHREDVPGRVTLRLEGTLDGRTALQLSHSLEQLGPTAELELDFSRVRDFRDTAVAVLTRGLLGRQVQLRGLPTHQQKLFRYFGVATGPAAGERAYYTPEEFLAS